MSNSAVTSSSNNYQQYNWSYKKSEKDGKNNSTKPETSTQVSIMQGKNGQSLNQADDKNGIQLGTDTSVASQNSQSTSSVNKNAGTEYSGSANSSVKAQIGEDGNFVKQADSSNDKPFSGFLEFDNYSEDKTASNNPFSNGKSSNYNRNSAETREKFDNELNNLTKANNGDFDKTLKDMSDGEIMALNHFGGNAFVGEDGKMYRQPTDGEVKDGKSEWIPIDKNSNEYKVRQEAMRRMGQKSFDDVKQTDKPVETDSAASPKQNEDKKASETTENTNSKGVDNTSTGIRHSNMGTSAVDNTNAAQSSKIKPKQVNDLNNINDLDEFLKSGKPGIIKIGTEWCGPCKQMEPHLQNVAAKSDGTVNFGRVDADKANAIASKYGITSYPTVLAFNSKGELVGKKIGGQSEQQLRGLLRDLT